MSQYLLLKKIDVQNANAISGLTYGFPGVTNFLGFAHALSRKFPADLGVNLNGVAVISHKNDVQVRQPKGWGDYVFALTRNPLTHQGKTAPINEEGRMNMQVSLLIEVNGLIQGDEVTAQTLVKETKSIAPTLRLAGGQIIAIENINIIQPEEEQLELRRLMPGFALVDRSDYLVEHFKNLKAENNRASMLDAWCDFSTIKYKAERVIEDVEQEGDLELSAKANWNYIPKPKPGYLVPINSGYTAISPVYAPGEVDNVRDSTVPAVFAEAAYSVGEWKSVHGLKAVSDAVWRYEHKCPWYLAKSQPIKEDDIVEPDFEDYEVD